MRQAVSGLLVLGMLLLTGCWDRLEVQDLAIVLMAGVDPAEEGVRLTVSVLVPARARVPGGGGGTVGESEGDGGVGGARYSAVGVTLMDAAASIQTQVSRRLFWGHTRVLVFGEEFARQGVRPALDYWVRHPQPRLLMQVVVARGAAVDFLSANPQLEQTLTEAVREINNARAQLYTTIKDFVWALRMPGEQPVAPLFEVAAGTPDRPRREVRVTGAALFREDRMVGAMDEAESRGLLWLRDEILRGVITVDVPTGGKVSLEISSSHTDVQTKVVWGKPVIHVLIKANVSALESSAPIDMGKDETYRVIRSLAEERLLQRLRQTLDAVQKEYQVDVVRFSDSVSRTAPGLWESGLRERWEQVFPRVPVKLFVELRVARTGKTGAPLEYSDKQVKQGQKQLLKERR